MHRNVERVVAAGRERGVEVEPRAYPESTRTAAEAAAAIGVDVGQIVKSLVFQVDGAVAVALVSGANQLDENLLAAAAGATTAERADAAAVREATGCPIGGVPPFGHAESLPVYVDQDLLAYEELWAAAGTPHVNFAITPASLVSATHGTVCELRRS